MYRDDEMVVDPNQAGQGRFAPLGAAVRRNHGVMGGVTAPTTRMPAVPESVENLARCIELLHSEIEQLENKLNPILRMEPGNSGGGPGEQPRESVPPLADALRQLGDRLAMASRHVADIGRRVEM